MRKETSNQFTEGLVSDLNPINTPNTALTDALNATIITYDGNEHSLQNDRGNYPLKNCRLQPNYIPVGLKEYGDILYIVSYNPLNNHVEIGSYPSPLNVESSTDIESGLVVDSVIESFSGTIDYSDLVKSCKLHIYTGGDEERFKIFPGDQYCLEKVEKSKYKYEELKYFIVDDNRKKYDVTDLVKNDSAYHNVPWQIPGWLAAQYRIGNFEDFNLSIRSFKVPTMMDEDTITCNASLHFQFKVSDKLFLVDQESSKTDIYIRVKIKAGSQPEDGTDIPLKTDGKFVEWYSDSKLLWTKYDLIIEGLSKNDNIYIEATPCVQIDVGGVKRTIIYNHLSENYSLTLNTIGSYSDFNIGNKLWKFYAESDGMYLEYDVTGPNVTSDTVNLYYQIKSIVNNTVLVEWKEMEGYSGISDHVMSWIKFDNQFKPEDMYILELAFAPNKDQIPSNTHKKLIIASSIFGSFVGEYDDFRKIYFDDWAVNQYENTIKFAKDSVSIESSFKDSNKDATANYGWNGNKDFINEKNSIVFENDSILRNTWKLDDVPEKGWVKSNEASNHEKAITVEFAKEWTSNSKIKLSNVDVLQGKLWEGTPGVDINVGNISRSVEREKIVGTHEIDASFNQTKTKEYKTKVASNSFKTIGGVEEIHKLTAMWLRLEFEKSGANAMINFSLFNEGVLEYSDNYETCTWNEKHSQYGALTLSQDPITLPNNITRHMVELLGENQIGILGLHVPEITKAAFRIDLKHGTETVKELRNGDPSRFFTYLVIRYDTASNYLALVPFSNNNLLWDISTDTELGSWHSAYMGTSEHYDNIINWGREFLKNLKIVKDDNAISQYKLLNIDNSGVSKNSNQALNLKISSPDVTSWTYGSYDLLDISSRSDLATDIGVDVGYLLTGNEKMIPSKNFVDKDQNAVLTEQFIDDKIKKDFDEKVRNINSWISAETQNDELLALLDGKTNTRGVYSYSSKNKNLIDKLSACFSSTSSDYLTANQFGTGNLTIDLISDSDNTIALGKVSTSIFIE